MTGAAATIPGGEAGGVPGGVRGDLHGGVRGGVSGGVPGGVPGQVLRKSTGKLHADRQFDRRCTKVIRLPSDNFHLPRDCHGSTSKLSR